MSQETFHRQTATYLAKVGECMPVLPKDEMQFWIDNPSDLKAALARALVREIHQADSKNESKPWEKVWKTINLGTRLKTANAFRTALKAAGYQIGDYANDILGKCEFEKSIAATPTSVDLILLTVGELGFKSGATREKIYAKAKKLGLELLPAEAGPQLRLQYTDQPMNEWNVIGMNPITNSDGDLSLFYVTHDGDGQWLRSDGDTPSSVWGHYVRFAFARKVQ